MKAICFLQKTYDLFIGEVVLVWADTWAFENGCWKEVLCDLYILYYVAGGTFFIVSETLELKKN